MASLELTGRLLVLCGEGLVMFDIIVNSFRRIIDQPSIKALIDFWMYFII